MRFLVVWASVVLVSGLALAKLHAEEMPDLKDPKVIAAGHELFLEKQCAHCHGEDGRGGVNLARRDARRQGRLHIHRGRTREERHPHAGVARGAERRADLGGDSLRPVDQPAKQQSRELASRPDTVEISLAAQQAN